MEIRAHPPGLQDVLTFPLVEALYGRRARRFSLGASIPDGPRLQIAAHRGNPQGVCRTTMVFLSFVTEGTASTSHSSHVKARYPLRP